VRLLFTASRRVGAKRRPIAGSAKQSRTASKTEARTFAKVRVDKSSQVLPATTA
jgi:hypothetical protein